MDKKTEYSTTTYVTISTTDVNGQTVQEHWPVTKTDYSALLNSPTALPVRLTVSFEHPFSHDDLLQATGLFYWNWLDEPADGLVFTAFHTGGQLPKVILRYFDESHSLLIAGVDEDKVHQIQQQMAEVVKFLKSNQS